MSIDSLEKLRKMTEVSKYEPKKSNRWLVRFPDYFNIETWMVKHVTPVIYDAENKKWEEITITLIDTIPKSAAEPLSRLIQKGNYHNFDLKMTLLNPVGEDVEDYNFSKCNIKTIHFGETDYNINDFKAIKLSINFKKCIIN